MSKLKRVMFSTGVCLILLVSVFGCAAEQTTSNAIPANTNPPSETRAVPRATSTIHFVPNPPTKTPTPQQSGSVVVTFLPVDKLLARPTATISSKAICPIAHEIADEEILIKLYSRDILKDINRPGFSLYSFEESEILDILNQYGISSFQNYINRYGEYYLFFDSELIDLTNDNNPELLIHSFTKEYIIGCQEGKFVTLKDFDGMYFNFIEMNDGNHNGVPEFLLANSAVTGCGSPSYSVYEWDGKDFVSILRSWEEFNGDIFTGCGGTIKFIDLENDGVFELEAYLGELWPFYFENDLPWRGTWEIYKWDGQYYSLYRYRFSNASYRFQVILDGDLASLYREYDQAHTLYKRAISDSSLDWWSAEKRSYLYNQAFPPTATSTAKQPVKDPGEFPNLAAYAYYRIMLLDILQGNLEQAESGLELLKNEYGAGMPGSIFTHLATVFMQEYQPTHNMEKSCSNVIKAVEENQTEVFKYLGVDGEMGFMFPFYTPQDICPFE